MSPTHYRVCRVYENWEEHARVSFMYNFPSLKNKILHETWDIHPSFSVFKFNTMWYNAKSGEIILLWFGHYSLYILYCTVFRIYLLLFYSVTPLAFSKALKLSYLRRIFQYIFSSFLNFIFDPSTHFTEACKKHFVFTIQRK